MFKKEQTRKRIGMSKIKYSAERTRKWLAPLLDLQLYEREREAVKGFIKMRWEKREMKARLKWLDKKISLLSKRVEIDRYPSLFSPKLLCYTKLYMQAIEVYRTVNLTVEELENATGIPRGTWKRNRYQVRILALLTGEIVKKINRAKTDEKRQFWLDMYLEVADIKDKLLKSPTPKTVSYSHEKKWNNAIADLMRDEQNRSTEGKTPKRGGGNYSDCTAT
jgi:hypothetical protein